jgi:hypothetical protein
LVQLFQNGGGFMQGFENSVGPITFSSDEERADQV